VRAVRTTFMDGIRLCSEDRVKMESWKESKGVGTLILKEFVILPSKDVIERLLEQTRMLIS